MRRYTWLFAPFAALALAWQLNGVRAAAGISIPRGAGIALAVTILVWSVWLAPKKAPALATRVFFSVATAFLIWMCALELWLQETKVLALGLFALWSAGLVHATLLFILTRPPAGNGKLASALLKVALSACALSVSVTGAEALLRRIFPLKIYGIFPDDPTWGPWSEVLQGRVVPRPGFKGEFRHPEFSGTRVEINALGLRDGFDEEGPPAPGETSVLVIGDSFTFGTGVELESTFHEQLEARAADIAAGPLRVFGGGVPGYGTVFARRRLIELAPKTQPDVVILGFFEGNDMQDNAREAELPSGLTEQVNDETNRLRGSLLRRFLQDIRRLQYWSVTCAIVRSSGIDHALVRWKLAPPTAPTNLFLEDGLLRPQPEWIARVRDAAIDELVELRRSCAERGADLIVLIIPDVIVAEPGRYEDFLSKRPAAQRAAYSRTALHDEFVALLEARGFRVVDMLETLEAESAAGRACYLREGHWNVHGHALAADRLVPVLAQLLKK